jgi:subtilisin family serine protease
LTRGELDALLFQTPEGRRHTQGSPLLPDVWFQFLDAATQPTERRRAPDVLLTPHWGTRPHQLASVLQARLDHGRVAFAENVVVAQVTFEEALRVLVPLTQWWQAGLLRGRGTDPLALFRGSRGRAERLLLTALRQRIAEEAGDGAATRLHFDPQTSPVQDELVWLVRVAGELLCATDCEPLPYGAQGATAEQCAERVRRFCDVYEGTAAPDSPPTPLLWRVDMNRRAATAGPWTSVTTVKADAASRVFEVDGSGIVWAVVDTGIDAKHPAFRAKDSRGVPQRYAFGGAERDVNQTRVLRTYDFVHVRRLLAAALSGAPLDAEIRQHFERRPGWTDRYAAAAATARERTIDWEAWAPVFEVPMGPCYDGPRHGHGTHVAGILAADWLPRAEDADPLGPPSPRVQTEGLRGVAPGLALIDVRVLDDNGAGDEFAVMAALQFIRWLNGRSEDKRTIHGINVSIAIRHDVANYACGATPVCQECERVVDSGVVVVAAAGNAGFRKLMGHRGEDHESYQSISITDPGNAEGVITVGATHKTQPHAYGVSYFSSRGPTGDGRIKPDLVAPGEKILSTLPDDARGVQDGTSMAAPHVSGVAALLLQRHSEFIGAPRRIKKILCDTATDLGRERYFQGHGLVDALRALQAP